MRRIRGSEGEKGGSKVSVERGGRSDSERIERGEGHIIKYICNKWWS